MFNTHAKASGIYRINDNIEKFEFTIYFRHINSILKLPQFNLEQVLQGKIGQQDSATAETHAVKVTRIKWQEKIFSATERELYKDSKNCLTAQHKRYHELLQRQALNTPSARKKAKTKKNKRSQEQEKNPRELSTQESLTNTTTTTKTSSEFEIFTYVEADEHTPATEQSNWQLQQPLGTCVSMYVYVDLQPSTQLVSFKWYPAHKLMHIYPNFNSMTVNPYFIEIDKDYRDFFAYAVQNSSKARSTIAQPQLDVAHLLQAPGMLASPYWQHDEELTKLFEMPPKRTQRVALLLDIRRASHFSYNNLHVRYHIRLPARTKLEEGLLTAATHSACASNGTAQFGYNWQLTLLCLEDYNPSSLLHIYFEVISIDSWERERIEGYAHYATFLKPGEEQLQLTCIRPAEGLHEKLQRYFVGGRRNFDFERFFSATAEKKKFCCRYQCRMEQTGCLEFNVAKIMQSNCELLQASEHAVQRTHGMTLDDIMMAFREARRRLQDMTL